MSRSIIKKKMAGKDSTLPRRRISGLVQLRAGGETRAPPRPPKKNRQRRRLEAILVSNFS